MSTMPTTIDEFRSAARKRLPRMVFDFVDGGAEDEQTVRTNREAFERLSLRPRRMVDVSAVDQSTTLLGQRVARPVVLGPTGLTRLINAAGEPAVARAAARAGAVYVVSTMSNASIEQIRAASTGELWFQVYLWREKGIVERLVERARQYDYRALVVGVDVPVVGTRERDVRNGLTIPPRARPRTVFNLLGHPRWLAQAARGGPITFGNVVDARPGRVDTIAKYVNDELTNPGAGWDEIARLRDTWAGPLLLKGISTAEDTAKALEVGVDGLVVSNHGGRQLDGEVAALQALPEVVDAAAGRLEVYLDGGVRRGSDVLKAFALGARACFVGRPYLFGLGARGEAGVDQVLEIFRTEVDRALALTGCPRLEELDRSYVVRTHADTW